MSTPTEQELLEREVLAELEAGNWPLCDMCHRVDQVGYVGMIAGSPTFTCARCCFFFAMHLGNLEEPP
jgi:hypothetical protein